MEIVVKASLALIGEELQIAKNVVIGIQNGAIAWIGRRHVEAEETIKADVAVPGFINAHTHTADSAFKDAGLGLSASELYGRSGLKLELLRKASEEEVKNAIRNAVRIMMRSGVVAFADFREGGLEGVRIFQEAVEQEPTKALCLGQPLDSNLGTARAVIERADGFGLRSPVDFSNDELRKLASMANNKLRAVHVAETPEIVEQSIREREESDVRRAVEYFRSNLLVHLNYASKDDLALVAARRIPVVCCPRSSSLLGLKLPPVVELLRMGVNVALGTDNVMTCSPDLLREMEFTLTAYGPRRLKPLEVLRMVTINGARAIGMREIGAIEVGKRADLVLFNTAKNLAYSRDVIASIVHRADPDDIEGLLVRGRLAYYNRA